MTRSARDHPRALAIIRDSPHRAEPVLLEPPNVDRHGDPYYHVRARGSHVRASCAMRILVDLTHPGDVHFFRHAIHIWRRRNHTVLVTARRKDIVVDLLQRFGIEHDDLGAARSGLLGLTVELLSRTY